MAANGISLRVANAREPTATVSPTRRRWGAAAILGTVVVSSGPSCGHTDNAAPRVDSTNVVASVVVSPESVSLAVSNTAQLAATVRATSGNVISGGDVSWRSSKPDVATVSSAGLVTALTAGNATVTATSSGTSGNASVSVVAAATCALVEGVSKKPTAPLAKPGYLQSVTDPAFGTTITRISGDPGTPIPVVGGTWSTVVYGNYPKDPAWNADQSLLLLKHTGNPAATNWLFLDGQNYRVLFARSGPRAVEARWHPTAPAIMLFVSADGSVGTWNPRTDLTTLKFTPSGYSSASLGNYEGNPSRDGRSLVVEATRNADAHLVAFAVDVDAATKGPDIDLTAANITNLDWVSISPSGSYVVAYGVIDGTNERTKVWRRDGSLVGYWQDYPLGHYDLGLDQSGNEVAFGAVSRGPLARHYIARRLDTGAVLELTGAVTSFNWHATTRAAARPEWGYAATNDNTGAPLDGEIYSIRLDGSGTVQRYVHHRSNNIDYNSAPLPTPSPDGRRVLFGSNWGAATGKPMQAYVLDTRQLCPNGLPQ